MNAEDIQVRSKISRLGFHNDAVSKVTERQGHRLFVFSSSLIMKQFFRSVVLFASQFFASAVVADSLPRTSETFLSNFPYIRTLIFVVLSGILICQQFLFICCYRCIIDHAELTYFMLNIYLLLGLFKNCVTPEGWVWLFLYELVRKFRGVWVFCYVTEILF